MKTEEEGTEGSLSGTLETCVVNIERTKEKRSSLQNKEVNKRYILTSGRASHRNNVQEFRVEYRGH